jgi:nitrogen fixation protein FixH
VANDLAVRVAGSGTVEADLEAGPGTGRLPVDADDGNGTEIRGGSRIVLRTDRRRR